MHASLIVSILLPLLRCIAASGVPIVVSPGLNISSKPNVTAHLPPCTDLAGSHAPTIPCYNTLDVNLYLNNYNLTSAEVCAPDQSSFGTCLLPTVYGAPGVNCTMINATESTCIPFDCVNLTSTACPAPAYNATMEPAQAWYAVYNVYQVHQFVYSWAAALNVTSSQKAITNAVNPRIPNTATTVMVTLINKYGLNKNADAALIKMLQVPTQTPQPTFDNFRVRGESSTPSAAKWQVLLVARLQDTLAVVMDDFDAFLGAVGNGTFSTRGLATASDLKAKLKEASASKVASASSHKSTASSHASSHTAATGPSSSQMVTTQSTVSTRSPVSTMATVSAHRPVGESTGP